MTPKTIDITGFFETFQDTPMAYKQYSCHILKPLECINIPGIAGVFRHFLLLLLLAYHGLKSHSFNLESSIGSSKSGALISFYDSLFAPCFNSSCASSKPRLGAGIQCDANIGMPHEILQCLHHPLYHNDSDIRAKKIHHLLHNSLHQLKNLPKGRAAGKPQYTV